MIFGYKKLYNVLVSYQLICEGEAIMQRDMDLVIAIMKELSAAHSEMNGASYVASVELEQMLSRVNSVILPVEICPDEETVSYHLRIMEERGLVGVEKNAGFLLCHLTWEGNDFLAAIEQEGARDVVERIHGDKWRNWNFNVMTAVFTEVCKKLALQGLPFG